MKKYSILLAISALIIASLACQTLMSGGSDSGDDIQVQPLPPIDNSDSSQPTEEAPSGTDFNFGNSDFPITDDASNVLSVGGVTNYQTKLSLDEVLSFYRDYYGKAGYTERELLTTLSNGVFSIVFDGDPSGQAVVIQGVDLGDGTVNVNISLQDV